jgi:uncharacterized protein (TIGR03790 family)
MADRKRGTSIRLAFELLERRYLLTSDVAGALTNYLSFASDSRPDGTTAPYTDGGAPFNVAAESTLVSSAAASSQPAAGPTANNVLLLYNTASSAGTQIANYYAQVHPGVHLLGINGVDPTSEDISADAYLNTIRPQVISALTPSIDIIVTTKGLPLRINVTEPALSLLSTYVDSLGTARTVYSWKQYSSLESELSRVDTISTWQMMGDQGILLTNQLARNPYYLSNSSFSHATYGTRLTSRLDGYTVGDVEAAIDRAQHAFIGPHNNPNGPFYFLVDNDPTKSYSQSMAKLVNNVLTPDGLPVIYDNTTAFVGTAPGPVIGYDSHGVHQASTPPNYIVSGLNLTLANGAVFESWESFNAYSFTTSNPHGNQGQVAQWLQIGGTAGVGNVEEPTASSSTITNEDQMFKMLIGGYTFAEAAWSATMNLSYVNTVVGDPLMTWKTLLGGDSNMDGHVDSSDLATLTAHWGQTVAAGDVGWAAGDFNGDGRIDILDLAILSANLGKTSSWAVAPASMGGPSGSGAVPLPLPLIDPSPNTIPINVTPVASALAVVADSPSPDIALAITLGAAKHTIDPSASDAAISQLTDGGNAKQASPSTAIVFASAASRSASVEGGPGAAASRRLVRTSAPNATVAGMTDGPSMDPLSTSFQQLTQLVASRRAPRE